MAILVGTSLSIQAAPIFALPNGAVHPPGFVVLMPSPGVALLPPGGALGPLFFGDGLASPDLHHWELELNNPNPFGMGFNVSFVTPSGIFGGGVGLPAGSSLYFDVMYADAPPEVGAWSITAVAAVGMPGPIFLDTDVLEYPFPVGAVPGIGAAIPGGPPGAVFGAPFGGAPVVTLTIGPVPEPTTGWLLGLGALGVIHRLRRRDPH